ncbi:MAG: beta-galactosidase [Verrucomicrobiia bacterium]
MIAVVADPRFATPPHCTGEDVLSALRARGCDAHPLRAADLATLDRRHAAVVVIPYLHGELTEVEWAGLLAFHEAGGGIVLLGDTPHVGRAYPLRNKQASLLRLSSCRDGGRWSGVTPEGRALLGDLPGGKALATREITSVRSIAFPPDETVPLATAAGGFQKIAPIVLVRRRARRFLGARLAMAGYEGGEPRENILGVCQRPWQPDYGPLDCEWPGFAQLVAGLVSAVEAPPLAVVLDLDPCAPGGKAVPVRVWVRNLSTEPAEAVSVFLREGEGEIARETVARLGPGETVLAIETRVKARPGPQFLESEARDAAGNVASDGRPLCGFLADGAPTHGLGFSTFWSFRGKQLDPAFVDFVGEMKRQGAEYARFAVSWEDTEPEPGKYDWSIPDQMLALAGDLGLPSLFWIFPTARGSGLGDAGVPSWVLREPSVDRHGKAGNFPCIWSPFYRERYFGYLEQLCRRYATDARLLRFVFDFGNSDFPYCYHYYGGPGDIFDYSPHEQEAFARWLRDTVRMPLDEVARRWGRTYAHHEEIPVPFSEQTAAWLIYEEFRAWGVYEGEKEAAEIIRRHALKKLPPDLPGHGLGSIADLGTYALAAQGRLWDAVDRGEPRKAEAHNSGREWGGEAWQVGGCYGDYDDALFQSVRLGAAYLTIPGPDLGAWNDDVARIAAIRRSIAGAQREEPRVAIIDRMVWNDFTSLAHVGARLDQPVDLLASFNRFDLARYRLLVLPPNETFASARGTQSLLPTDREWYAALAEAVRRGLRVLVFPDTGASDPNQHLRKALGIEATRYTPRERRTVAFPSSFGGGTATGLARGVRASGARILLPDDRGEALLAELPLGAGGVLLAGWDTNPDSLDGAVHCETTRGIAGHTLARLLAHLGLPPSFIRTGQAFLYKELVRRGEREFLLFYSHQREPLELTTRFRARGRPHRAIDLANGKLHAIRPSPEPGWFDLALRIEPRTGAYLSMEG